MFDVGSILGNLLITLVANRVITFEDMKNIVGYENMSNEEFAEELKKWGGTDAGSDNKDI